MQAVPHVEVAARQQLPAGCGMTQIGLAVFNGQLLPTDQLVGRAKVVGQRLLDRPLGLPDQVLGFISQHEFRFGRIAA